MFRRLLKLLILVLVVFLLAGASFTLAVYLGLSGPVPDKSELQQIQHATASVIQDRHGESIGRIFAENRTNASFEELPVHLVNALIATEDARFFEHEGIDPRSVARVLIKTLLMGDRGSGGGSTISQQLAKNLYGRSGKGAFDLATAKLKEMIIATRLEDVYGKEDLIELYLNTVPFSENIYGIETAAERFFDIPVSQLATHQSAVLIGMLKANTYYNPRLHPDHALERRNVVLGQMRRYEYLSPAEADSLIAMPLDLDYKNLNRDGPADYYLRQVREEIDRILKEESLDTDYNPYTNGLVIVTTLDLGLQNAAKAAYNKHLNQLQSLFDKHWSRGDMPWDRYPQVLVSELQKSRNWRSAELKGLSEDEIWARMKQVSPALVYNPGGDTVLPLSPRDSVIYYLGLLRAGFVALDPGSGAVLSWVGGRDYDYMPYDHVLARRQAASTFKPIVFATALEAGIEPCHYWENELRQYPEYENWTPNNYSDNYGGFYSMSGILQKSLNVPTVQAYFDVGMDPILEMAKRVGIESELPEHPSLALGAGSLSPLELARAYAAFANDGIQHETYFVESISNADGKVLYKRTQPEGRRVMKERTAILMNMMLLKVVEQGTARSLQSKFGVSMQLAGKTGTSQDYSDAWFVAYTPKIVAATWVGGIYPAIRFRSGEFGSSTKQALPMLGYFFLDIEQRPDLSEYLVDFQRPSSELLEELDCPDFREKNLMDGIKNLFDPGKGQKVEKEEKEGLFKKLFGKKK